uniref:Uncharacterized protein n=1 Tax=Chromera velia CCMP2878 TaxID=1169474 RepID=A0A0G4ICW4_9ALVE|eukprot:Cvel_2305.t1-p1 / transcript=Cvel_2305.t1 / gene=Cvel_2305 / organism=Chromera_velia_CCMP2878 / gene_product=hypothetical protein / transcript_product=hypothetical protein / location=Cvel_scaffold89:51504-61699(+) / protein_length=188 / sequence_SO=supercontig / SO=protein_coding / is_pseudo=false
MPEKSMFSSVIAVAKEVRLSVRGGARSGQGNRLAHKGVLKNLADCVCVTVLILHQAKMVREVLNLLPYKKPFAKELPDYLFIQTRCLVVVLIDHSIFGLDENFYASGEVWQGDLLWVFRMGYRATVKCIKMVDESTAVLNTTRLVTSLIFVLFITRKVSARLNGFLLSVPGVGVLREETASFQLFHLF